MILVYMDFNLLLCTQPARENRDKLLECTRNAFNEGTPNALMKRLDIFRGAFRDAFSVSLVERTENNSLVHSRSLSPECNRCALMKRLEILRGAFRDSLSVSFLRNAIGMH